MGKINVLSFFVANLIAAGEVVDRPSSAVKEMLENSIDSGATHVIVEIQNGGTKLIRITDDGCGMEPDDIPVSIRRHATSKIKTEDDLDGIETLGFRGEALASIAAVSRMRIISRVAENKYGAALEVDCGNILSLEERACPKGTTIIVENLFSNVPARRKFLKRDATEASSVGVVVEKMALSRPEIAFRLIVDGNVKLETSGDGDLSNTIYSVFGREFSQKLIKVDLEADGIHVSGYIGRSDNVKANRSFQNFFINGRYVKSKTAIAAIEQAYNSYMPSDKFPCCVINLKINPKTVDVNIHPAKLEVRFSNEKTIFDTIYYAVRTALENDVTRPEVTFEKPRAEAVSAKKVTNAFIPVEDERKSYKNLKISFEDHSFVESNRLQIATNEDKIKASENTNVLNNVTKETKISNNLDNFIPSTTVSSFKEDVLSVEKTLSTLVKPSSDVASGVSDADVKEEIVRKSGDVTEKLCQGFVEAAIKETSTGKNEVIATEADQKPVSPEEKVGELNLAEKETVSNETKVDEVEVASVVNTDPYKILGESFNSYVFVEHGDKVLVIDKHAAHERVIFEELRRKMQSDERTSQLLMIPIEVMLTTDELQALESYRADVEKIGFGFDLKKHSAEIFEIPSGVGVDAVRDMFIVIADRIINETGNIDVSRNIVFERALYQASCKAAIKAGREYPEEYVKWLVDKIMSLPDITFCPHGRPIAIEMTKNSLDKQFERK